MRFSLALSTLALAASSVQAWLPALLTPKAGDVYSNGDVLTITWDNSTYNSSARSTGKFLLGHSTDGGETTVVSQFLGKASSYGSEYDLWNTSNSLDLTIDVVAGTDGLGEQVWYIIEFPLDQKQVAGPFTINA
ncbi:hypothetical protein JCM8097_008164 [Rhodosporidiobolus ruineniae]